MLVNLDKCSITSETLLWLSMVVGEYAVDDDADGADDGDADTHADFF